MKYTTYIVKRQIEDVLLYPFILTGHLIARIKPLSKSYNLFYFFPFYHTGGAEKVHALVTQATGSANCIIFFTRKSQNDTFYPAFKQSGCDIKIIAPYTDNKLLYFLNFIYRGIVAGYINRQKGNTVVFNGQCNFAYKISPWINRKTPQIELIHSFNTFSWIRLPFLPFITKTICISKVRIDDHLKQYKKIEVPNKYHNAFEHIVNGIQLPAVRPVKNVNGKIGLLYAGRGTTEKRVHIIAEIARQAHIHSLPVEVIFMGEVKEAIPENLKQYCTLLGEKKDPMEIDEIYWQAHINIITSDTEGFPMVIEEAMARECVIIATPVGDIPVHIQPHVNGFMFTDTTNEQQIVKEALGYLTLLAGNRGLIKEIGKRNRRYAEEHFDIEQFNRRYRILINQLTHHH